MVTTHFYEEATVAAQLIYSLMNGNNTIAFAAASELAASDPALLFRVLCFVWWLSPPDHPLQSARSTAFLNSDAHALYSALSAAPFQLPSLHTPAAITKPLSEVKKAIKKRQTAVVYAAALTLSQSELAAIGIDTKYLDAMAATIYKPLEYRILEHACAALTAYVSVAPAAPPWSHVPFGARAGRTFFIEDASLITWGVKKPPQSDLRDPTKLIPVPLFETEEDEIAFFESHFPDDIPDEWPDTEVSKSHGICESGAVDRCVWRIAFLDLLD